VVSLAGTDQQPSYQMYGDSKTADGDIETRQGSRNVKGQKGAVAPTHAVKAHNGNGGILPLILNSGTTRR